MNMRKVTALTALVSFVVLIVNSVVLYIVPQGRVAYWANWHLWGLTKTEWGDQHIIIGLLFLIAIFLHIYYNWKPVTSYLKNKARQFRLFTKEFNIALIITIVCIIGSYFTIPPFNWILDLSESIKEAAAVKYGEPPYGHAELSTLKRFTRNKGFNLDESMQRLKKAGIRFENERQTLKEIAKTNKISPQQVYLAMKPAEESGRPEKMPDSPVPGTGKRSLTKICQTYDLDINTILKGFVDHNIRATAAMNLKEIAAQNNKGPREIYDIIKKITESQATSSQATVTRAVEKQQPQRGTPSGLGRKTIAEVCENYGINLKEALEKLSAQGIKAQSSDKMKKLAVKYDKLPIDLYEIMK